MSAIEALCGLALVLLAALIMVLYFDLRNLARAPSFLGVYFVSHVLMLVLPAASFVGDDDRPHALTFFWAAVATACLIPLAGIAANLLLGSGGRQVKPRFFATPLAVSRETIGGMVWFVYCSGLVVLAITAAYVQIMPAYPLKAMLLSLVSTEDLNIMRADANAGYLFGMVQFSFFPIVFLSIVAVWRYRKDPWFRAFALGVAIAIFFYNSYATRKTPVALLFLIWFLLLYCRNRSRATDGTPNRGRKRLYVVGGVIASLVIMYPVFVFQHKAAGEGKSVLEIVKFGIVDRLLLKPANNTYYAFEVFPDVHEHTYFMDLKKLADISGADYVSVSSVIASYKRQSEITLAPPTTIGRFYAQGGWPVLIIGIFVMSALLQGLQIYFEKMRSRRTLYLEVAYIFCLWGAFRLSMGYFYGVFLSEVFVPVLVVGCAVSLLRKLSRQALPPVALRPRLP